MESVIRVYDIDLELSEDAIRSGGAQGSRHSGEVQASALSLQSLHLPRTPPSTWSVWPGVRGRQDYIILLFLQAAFYVPR